MWKKIIVLSLFLLWLATGVEVIKPGNENEIKIAFGSGNKKYNNEKSKIFYSVARFAPDAWIWLGDSAYLDDRVVYGVWAENKNLTELKQRYRKSLYDPAYENLRNNTRKIMGVWNDHDYGIENGDWNFSNKNVTKKLFLDFLGERRGSERREHYEGIYASYYLGEKKRVKVILLDVRYNRKKDDILGETQWKWLEKELWDNDAVVTIFASGMQIMPDDRYFTVSWDEKSREQLYKLLKKTNTKGPIFLSGDSGFGEVMLNPCSKKTLGLDLYEATSNGLTYSLAEDIPFGQYFQTFLFPETFNKAEDRYNKKNFGIIEIKFSENSVQDTQIHIEIRNDVGTSSVSKYFDLDSITPDMKRKKEASKEECKLQKPVSYRRVTHVLGRIKQFDIFFIFVISLPFVTVWLVYISCKQFYEIFHSCCSDEEIKDENDENDEAQQQEEEEGEEELEEEKKGEEQEPKKEIFEKPETNKENVLKDQERKEKEFDQEEEEEEEEKKEERKETMRKTEEKKEEEEWTTVKKKNKKPQNKKKKAKVL